MTDQQKISAILKRRQYFDLLFPTIERCDARQDINYPLSNSCPICGYMTLSARCSHDICSFCFWQDDGQDNPEAEKTYLGPNDVVSINEYRIETFDWMVELKEQLDFTTPEKVQIGKELKVLDSYIESSEAKSALVLNQINLLSRLFDQLRLFQIRNV